MGDYSVTAAPPASNTFISDASPVSTVAPITAAMPKTPLVTLELENIVQDYPSPHGKPTRIVDGVSLRFDGEGINTLLGPSGCGKSTLLRMMGGVRPNDVQTPTSGRVVIDGIVCDGPHDDVVTVFQKYANRPDLSVFDNVAFPFRLKLWKRK